MYTNHQIRNFKNFLFKNDNTRPFLRIVKENLRISFLSIYACAEYLQCEPKDVWDAFINNELLQGFSFHYIRYNDTEAIYAKSYQYSRRENHGGNIKPGVKRPVKVLNLHTNEINEYCSVKSAGEELGIHDGNVRASISTPTKYHLLYEQYVVVDADRTFDFVTDEVRRELLAKVTVPVVVFDSVYNTLNTFSSLSAYLRITKQSTTLPNKQRSLRVKGIIKAGERCYVIRLTDKVKSLDELGRIRHFKQLIKEVIER